jgi:DTW domain-containing protein YfiP
MGASERTCQGFGRAPMDPTQTAAAPRQTCYECHKPHPLCVCGNIRRVDNRTGIIVVQHPRERLHPIGTARFVRLGLAQARVEVAWNSGVREDRIPAFIPEGAALLYPGPGARNLAELPEAERPRHLVVIDGTWNTARTLYRDKTWLHGLPRVRLSPEAPSNYRIRREPSREHVSTLEAIAAALRILEPETAGIDELLRAFDLMIDAQLEFIARAAGAPRSRDRRPRSFRRLPRALVEDFDRLVVAYVESARPDPRGERSLAQFVAVRPSTGETFERLLMPPFGPPSPAHLAHMGLTIEDFGEAVEAPRFRREVDHFLGFGPEVVLSAWNQSSLDLLAGALGIVPSRVSLKSAYRNVRGGGSGSLDDVVAGEGLAPEPLRFRGRAGLRAARAVAIARHLNALATGPSEDHLKDAAFSA